MRSFALVRAPGDYGFDRGELWAGVLLAAAGAVIGILAFAYVMAPLNLTNDSLAQFDVDRLPGHSYETASELLGDVNDFKQLVRRDRIDVADAVRSANAAAAASATAEKTALEAEAAAKAAPDDPKLKEKATAAREAAERARSEKEAAAAEAAAQTATHEVWRDELTGRERLRADAFRLKAADAVGERFRLARGIAVLSVALVAAGFVFLALAPIEKTPDAAAAKSPVLVSWAPNAAGTAALGCDTKTVQGLQIGGDDSAPVIVTFPTTDCPAKLITFPKAGQTVLGPVTKVESVPTGGA